MHTVYLFRGIIMAGALAWCTGQVWASELSVPVKAFLEEDYDLAAVQTRLDALPAALTEVELNALIIFLRVGASEEEAMRLLRQNDLADRLLQREDTVEATVRALIAVIPDEKQSVVWRDYSLQKLPLAYAKVGETVQREILQTLWQRVDDPTASLSGTSLLGLHRLYLSKVSAVDGEKVCASALRILTGSGYAEANRLTAMQIAAHHRSVEALEIARSWLNEPRTAVSLRVGGVAALGLAGNPEDAELVKRFLDSPDYRLRQAAQFAIRNLPAGLNRQ
jgi:hypothetical protein